MARSTSFSRVMNAIARDCARAAREAERAQKKAERERAAAVRLQHRMEMQQSRSERAAQVQQSKIEKAEYLQSRQEEVDEINAELDSQIEELQTILEYTLDVDDRIDFDELMHSEKFSEFRAQVKFTELPPEKPGFMQRLLPGWQKKFGAEMQQYEQRKAAFEELLSKEKDAHNFDRNAFLEKVRQRNAEVVEFRSAYMECDPEAVMGYNTMVLERSEYPEGFPQQFQIAYVPESRELVVDYQLPTIDVVPTDSEAKYVKAKGEISMKPRKPKEIKDLYQDIVAATAVRTIHEVVEADQANALDAVAFNGYVETRDRATGKQIKPYLISLRVTKEQFHELDLAHIDKSVCLRNLGAQVSPKPEDLVPVKPVVEFKMVDKRFIEQGDVLSDIESRPNLLDLTPAEFETLVSNLFGKLGLESKLTRSSRDGGVDCVAFDCRPVLGGKVVIQAKRYKHTVGVSAVRDLYGTMQHEGANKGILVTTSGYGPDAFEFSQDKPIELITGSQLLYLLEQVGFSARILFSSD